MTLNQKPDFSVHEAEKFISENYQMKGSCKILAGERDQNFMFESVRGEKFVLKITNPGDEIKVVEAENEVMKQAGALVTVIQLPVRDKSGKEISAIRSEAGEELAARLLSYAEGVPLAEVGFRPGSLYTDIGKTLGLLSGALEGYDNPVYHRTFNWDLTQFNRVMEDYSQLVTEPLLSGFIEKVRYEVVHLLYPVANKLRKAIIHNDANDYNLIVGRPDTTKKNNPGPVVKGLIDFGDMVYSYRIADLAVAAAYAFLGDNNPVRVLRDITAGYIEKVRVEPVEVPLVYIMARMRLALSICMAAQQMEERPDDEYLLISQEPIRKTIPLLNKLPWQIAASVVKEVCEGKVQGSFQAINDTVSMPAEDPAPLFGEDFTTNNTLVIDLSVEGEIIDGDPLRNSPEKLGERISRRLTDSGASYGIGRYLEPRSLYTSPGFTAGKPGAEERTIHLGVDIFVPAGTPIHSPYSGRVHAFSAMPQPLDYGHVIILSHEGSEGNRFFTLYGHLSSESLKNLSEGMAVGKGEVFARTGTPEENGGWAPHVHFQLISDLAGLGTGFPGVCSRDAENGWSLLSPDPNTVLHIPFECFPCEQPTYNDTLVARKRLTGSNLSLGYEKPLKMTRGWMQYMYDHTGQKYLDAFNNVPHIGHSHPEITEVIRRQSALLNTNTRYLHDSLTSYAELLLSTLPEQLSVCYFLNSASEANELAMRMSREYTVQKDMIVLEGAYHGNTTGLIDISPYKHNGPGGVGAPDWVHAAPVADCYRGKFGYDDNEAGKKYAHEVEKIIEQIEAGGKKPAAFIAETCPSVGGQIIFPDGYLKEVYKYVRKAGGLCIADEVQTGYGRTGAGFYAFEAQGVVPDIVVLGKPIGNGFPIGAVVTTKEVADCFDNGMEFFSTFGGSTVSCTVGRKVLEIVLRDNLQEHALQTGDYLLKKLASFKESYPLVGDVRGSGLFIGIELVTNHNTLDPAAEEASWIVNRLRDLRILAGTDGPYHNVIKIRPPMPFDIEDADKLVTALNMVLNAISI